MDQIRLNGEYERYLTHIGVNVPEVLRDADLDPALFENQQPSISVQQYYRFMEAIAPHIPDGKARVAAASHEEMKLFSPVQLAAYCSPDVRTCFERMARYKRISDIVHYSVIESENHVAVRFLPASKGTQVPAFLIEVEMITLIQLLRDGTQEHIEPTAIRMRQLPGDPAFSQYAGVTPTFDIYDELVFSKDIIDIPFVSRNDTMWHILKRELEEQEYESERDKSYAEQVRELLPDLLAEGQGTIEGVATQMHIGSRTLQRRLSAEHTSFTEILNNIRRLLAQEYLRDRRLSAEDVAYLLGYDESNSLLRAFRSWTGMTIGEYRRMLPSLDD